MENSELDFSFRGMILAHLLLIPHYTWMWLVFIFSFLKFSFFSHQEYTTWDVIKAIIISILFVFGLIFIIPLSFCFDFWRLAAAFSYYDLPNALMLSFGKWADDMYSSFSKNQEI